MPISSHESSRLLPFLVAERKSRWSLSLSVMKWPVALTLSDVARADFNDVQPHKSLG